MGLTDRFRSQQHIDPKTGDIVETFEKDPAPVAAPVNLEGPTLSDPKAAPKKQAPKIPLAEAQVVNVKRRLASLARRIKSEKKKAVQSLLAIGEALAEAQDLLADHNRGSFGKWVRDNCKFSRRSAYNFITIYRQFGGCAIVAQLIDDDALRMLAAAPEAAASEAIDLAEGGQHVTAQIAKQVIQRHKPKKTRSCPDPIHVEVSGGVIVIRPSVEGVDIEAMLREAAVQLRKKAAA